MSEQRFFHDTYNLRKSQFQKLRDCFEGQDAIREAGATYLPRPGGMPSDASGDTMYAAYKGRATYYPVLERTLRALLGIVFRVLPSVDLPEKLKYVMDGVTSDGEGLVESLRLSVLETLHMGRHGLLLDLPRAEATDAIPYIAHYQAEDITDWAETVRDGAKVLTMVMLRDAANEGDGRDIERFRELRLVDGAYVQRCWVCRAGKGGLAPLGEPETVVPLIAGKPLPYIPFWFIGPYGNRPSLQKSPMLDIANVTIDHYQVSADWRQALHMLAQPTPYIVGDIDEKQIPKRIGAGAFWVLPSTVQRVDMLEYSGVGVSSLEAALDKIENTAAGLGAKLIHRGRQPETAEAVRTKARDELSVVETTVMSTEDAYRGLLRTVAEWLGLDPSTVGFGMDRDFIEERIDSGMLAALIKACFDDKAISRPVYHANLQRGGIVPTSRSIEDEIADGATGEKKAGEAAGGSKQAADPADDPQATPEADPADGVEAVADTALNGAQVQALQGVVQAVADGLLPREAAKILIRKAFPSFSDDEVAKMIDDAEKFEPARTEAP
jgi:hypothetical protein